MVKQRLLIAWCFFLLSCMAATQTGRPLHDAKLADTYWCHLYRPWEAAPKDVADALGYQPCHTTGRILRLCPSGDLEIYGGVLNKVNDSDVISLSVGDGLTHFVGKWEASGDKVLLEYRLDWQDFPPIGQENAPHPVIREEAPFDGEKIVLNGQTFTPMRSLSKETIEDLFSCPPRKK
ncbi:MAG: hypothetical protein ACOYXN_01905 [Acidobacteriota bacterium]